LGRCGFPIRWWPGLTSRSTAIQRDHTHRGEPKQGEQQLRLVLSCCCLLALLLQAIFLARPQLLLRSQSGGSLAWLVSGFYPLRRASKRSEATSQPANRGGDRSSSSLARSPWPPAAGRATASCERWRSSWARWR